MLRLPRKVLCLDWDLRALRLVLVRVGPGGIQLEDAHSHRLPAGVDVDDPQSLGGFIQQMLSRHRLKPQRVLVDIPRDKAVINRLTVAPTPVNELPAVVRFQAMKELPFPLEQAAIDFVEMDRNGDGHVTEVLLAAVRAQTLQRTLETCAAAGLTAARVGLRPLANLAAVQRQGLEPRERVMFVEVGPTLTEIDVVGDGKLLFSRTAHVVVPPSRALFSSEDSFIAATQEIAELTDAETSHDTAVQDLLVEITRTLQAYRALESDGKIDRVVVAGGAEIETQLAFAIDNRFHLPTQLFDPSAALGISGDKGGKLRSFSAPLGLAWELGRDGSLPLDFLNPKRPVARSETLKRRVRLIGLAAAVVVLAVGGYWVNQIMQLQRTLAAINVKVAPAEGVLVKDADQRLDRIEMIEAAEDWQESSGMSVWLDHLYALTETAQDPGKQMVLRSLKLDSRGRTPSVRTDVLAADLDVLTQFIKALGQYDDGAEYVVRMERPWREGQTNHPKFKGASSIRAELSDLASFEESAKQREKDRKNRRSEVLAGKRDLP